MFSYISQGSNPEPLKDGIHLATISRMEEKTSTAGNQMMEVTFLVNGRYELRYYLVNSASSIWKIDEFVTITQGTKLKPGEHIIIEPHKFINAKVYLRVATPEGKQYPEIKALLTPSEAENLLTPEQTAKKINELRKEVHPQQNSTNTDDLPF